MKHLLDYRRDVQSNMTVCGKVVGDEFIVGKVSIKNVVDEEIVEEIIAEETDCPDCSMLQFRRDEPEEEVGIPDVEGMPKARKQERYGD